MRSWTTATGGAVTLTALVGAWAVTAAPQPVLAAPALALALLFAIGFVLLCHPASELQAVRAPLPASDDLVVRRRLVALAACFRATGLHGLEREQRTSLSVFESRGLRLVADGATAPELAAALRFRAAELQATQRAAEAVWRSVARGAINGGVVMALLQIAAGLTVAPPEQAAAVVAGALGATVYGQLIGWFIAYPQALRRRRAAAALASECELWIDGLAGVAAGINPRRLADRLNTAEPTGLVRVA